MKSVLDIEYSEGLMLDLHLPDNEEFDLFIYFHGGGLTSGDRKGVEVFASTLAKQNIATASVDYRLVPNVEYPEFIYDCAKSIKYLMDNINNYGKCKNIYVGGSSAGGYISMMLCFDKNYLNSVGVKLDSINGFIHDAGQPTCHFTLLANKGIDSRRLIVDETSPLFHVGLEEKYPPMQIIVSTEDIFGRYEQTMVLMSTLKNFGYDNCYLEVIEGKHCEHTYKKDEDGEGVFAKIILKFIEQIKKVD